MNIFSLLSFLAAAVYIYLGFYAWRKEPRSRLNQIFFLQCSGFAVWAFAYAFVYPAPSKEILWFWFKVSSLGWCTFGGISLHFFLLLTGKEKILLKRWIYAFLYFPGIVLVYQAWTGIVTAKDFIKGPVGWIEIAAPDSIWFWLHTLNFSFCGIIGLYLVWQWGRASKTVREKAQSHIIISTTAWTLFLGTLINIFLPALHLPLIPGVAPIIIIIWAIGMWQAIVKYRLMVLSHKIAADEIVSRMKDILILVDAKGNISKINPLTETLLGYREKELQEKPLKTIIPDEDQVLDLTQRNKNTLTPSPDREVALKSRDGGIIPANFSSSIILDNLMEPVGLVLVGQDLRPTKLLQMEIDTRKKAEEALLKVHDQLEGEVKERTKELVEANKKLEKEIVERKLSEEALRQSEERYRTILERIEDGYFEVDLRGNMLFCNEANARMVGYTPEELIGLNYREYTDPENAQKVFETFNRVYRTGLPDKGFAWVLTKPDGSKVYVETSVSPALDSDGQKIGFRGIVRDVTKQKQAEAALKTMSLVDDLTGLYNRRGFLTLAEQELKVAQRMERGIFLLFADVDDLKAINDTFGHLEGDQALIEIARIVKENFRVPDIIARIGGDEFVVLAIEGVSEAGPELLAERLRKNLKLFNEGSDRPYKLSLSIGIVGYDPEHPVSIDNLMTQADKNMYEEKQGKKKNTQLKIEF